MSMPQFPDIKGLRRVASQRQVLSRHASCIVLGIRRCVWPI